MTADRDPEREARPPRAAPPLRLFLALAPPPPVRTALAALADAIRRAAGPAGRALRFVPAENLHLTLRFLGAVRPERVPALEAAVGAVTRAAGPLGLRLSGAGAFPGERRARVIWAGLDGHLDRLASLGRALDAALAPLGFEPERRPSSPHVTLARARDPRGARGLAGPLEQAGAASPGAAWVASEVVLFRSELSRSGAVYAAIGRFGLGAPAPSGPVAPPSDELGGPAPSGPVAPPAEE